MKKTKSKPKNPQSSRETERLARTMKFLEKNSPVDFLAIYVLALAAVLEAKGICTGEEMDDSLFARMEEWRIVLNQLTTASKRL